MPRGVGATVQLWIIVFFYAEKLEKKENNDINEMMTTFVDGWNNNVLIICVCSEKYYDIILFLFAANA